MSVAASRGGKIDPHLHPSKGGPRTGRVDPGRTCRSVWGAPEHHQQAGDWLYAGRGPRHSGSAGSSTRAQIGRTAIWWPPRLTDRASCPCEGRGTAHPLSFTLSRSSRTRSQGVFSLFAVTRTRNLRYRELLVQQPFPPEIIKETTIHPCSGHSHPKTGVLRTTPLTRRSVVACLWKKSRNNPNGAEEW